MYIICHVLDRPKYRPVWKYTDAPLLWEKKKSIKMWLMSLTCGLKNVPLLWLLANICSLWLLEHQQFYRNHWLTTILNGDGCVGVIRHVVVWSGILKYVSFACSVCCSLLFKSLKAEVRYQLYLHYQSKVWNN